MKRFTLGPATVFILIFPQIAHGQELHLFGGSAHDVYLGCFNCGEYASESICNEFGAGSGFNTDSIFNEFSSYGNQFSSSSPWNEFSNSNDVPVLVDKQGAFYGYFTTNRFRADAVEFAANLAEMHDAANGDLRVVQKMLCRAIGG